MRPLICLSRFESTGVIKVSARRVGFYPLQTSSSVLALPARYTDVCSDSAATGSLWSVTHRLSGRPERTRRPSVSNRIQSPFLSQRRAHDVCVNPCAKRRTAHTQLNTSRARPKLQRLSAAGTGSWHWQRKTGISPAPTNWKPPENERRTWAWAPNYLSCPAPLQSGPTAVALCRSTT